MCGMPQPSRRMRTGSWTAAEGVPRFGGRRQPAAATRMLARSHRVGRRVKRCRDRRKAVGILARVSRTIELFAGLTLVVVGIVILGGGGSAACWSTLA